MIIIKAIRGFWLIILFCLCLVAATLLIAADLAIWVSAEHCFVFSILALGFELLFAANIVLVILSVFSSKKSLVALPLIALAISILPARNVMSISSQTIDNTNAPTYSIMSYNICGSQNYQPSAQNRVLQFIKQQQPDIVCLQELRTWDNKRYLTKADIEQFLNYPYSYFAYPSHSGNNHFGIAVFSKYPIVNSRPLLFEQSANCASVCDIKLGHDTVRLINNHLQSYSFSKDELQVDINSDSEQMRESAVKMSGKMREAYKQRSKQARNIHDNINSSPYPVIVCGDMNDVPVSYVYHKISSGLQDAFLDACPWQLGHTFKHNYWGVRIDYLLHSPSIKTVDFTIMEADYSDHQPVMATFTNQCY